MACHPHPLPSAPLSALLAAHSGSAAIPSFYGRLFEKPISFGTFFLGGGGRNEQGALPFLWGRLRAFGKGYSFKSFRDF